MTSVQEEKKQLRRHLLALRKTINADAHASALRDRFLEEATFLSYQIIGAYWPMAGEIDIRALLDGLCLRGQRCALPVVAQKDAPLIFRQWQSGDELVAGFHGTRQPAETSRLLNPDMVLVPLLGFDQNGGRLGFGGGYYDRTLADRPGVLAVGMAYDEQEVDAVPMDDLDQRMDWIVTPTRVIQVRV